VLEATHLKGKQHYLRWENCKAAANEKIKIKDREGKNTNMVESNLHLP
jgi:hypothetical protein